MSKVKMSAISGYELSYPSFLSFQGMADEDDVVASRKERPGGLISDPGRKQLAAAIEWKGARQVEKLCLDDPDGAFLHFGAQASSFAA